jgi:chromatin remodeling complex protein RSC6
MTDKMADNTTTEMETTTSKKNQMAGQFTDILQTLSAFRSQITMLQNQVRGLEKCVSKKVKAMEREAKKNKSKGNRKPSGFAVPTKITDELCDFMKMPHGSAVARTEVTQYIIKYIKENELQWKENRKIIKPDKALTSLLDVKAKDEVTYFNLQKYMNKHFMKTV